MKQTTGVLKRAGLFALSALMTVQPFACQAEIAAFAQEDASGEESPYVVEYANLRDLVIAGNLTVSQTYSDYYYDVDAYQDMWDTLKFAQYAMEGRADYAEEGSDEESLYDSNAKSLKSSARRINSTLEDMLDERSLRSLEQTADAYTMTAQTLMASCKKLEENIAATEKTVAVQEAAYLKKVREESVGAASAKEVLSAKQTYEKALNQLDIMKETFASSMDQFTTFIGFQGQEVVLGDLPEPDLSAIESVDFERDLVLAMGNDDTVLNARHASAAGSAQVELRFKTVAEAEGNFTASFTTTYEELLSAKETYLAAEKAYAAALLNYEALGRKNAAGMLSSGDYLEGEAAYLSSKATRDSASMDLLLAYEGYCWEVQGIG